MKNINKISLVGGLVFAIFDAVCAFLAAFALQPFVAFWSYIAHIRFTPLESPAPSGRLGCNVLFLFPRKGGWVKSSPLFLTGFTGAGVESYVRLDNVFWGIVGTFVLGYILTWIFVWLHQKFCCDGTNY